MGGEAWRDRRWTAWEAQAAADVAPRTLSWTQERGSAQTADLTPRPLSWTQQRGSARTADLTPRSPLLDAGEGECAMGFTLGVRNHFVQARELRWRETPGDKVTGLSLLCILHPAAT